MCSAQLSDRNRLHRAFRSSRNVGLMVSVLVLCFNCSGCAGAWRATLSPYEEMKRRACSKYTAAVVAKSIWAQTYERSYANNPFGDDAREGFVFAYVETELGGNGCPPPIPVVSCFSIEALTHSYPNASAWYEGYALGHAAALSRGVDRRRLAPLNPELRCNSQAFVPDYGAGSVMPNDLMEQGMVLGESESLPVPLEMNPATEDATQGFAPSEQAGPRGLLQQDDSDETLQDLAPSDVQ